MESINAQSGAVAHTVLLRWTPDAPADQGEKVAAALNSMAQDLQGTLFYHAGQDLGIKNGNAEFAVFAVFATPHDYLQYAQNPKHQMIIEELIAPYRAERATAQIGLTGWHGAIVPEQSAGAKSS